MRAANTANQPGPNLFLRHLPQHMLEPELEQLLAPHGVLKRLTVWKDHQTRQSKGFGMAEFETTEGAMRAMKALQGRELAEGAPLEIEYHHGRRRRDGTPDVGAPCTNLYVRGLPLAMTEDQLRDHLMQYGEIKRLTIWKDQFGRSKGFGMCEFTAAESARAALEALRGQSFDASTQLHVEVNPPKPQINHQTQFNNQFGMPGLQAPVGMAPQQQGPIPNIFIKGFPLSYEEADLQKLVSGWGPIKRVTIWRDRNTGASKGFGLVEFSDVHMAQNALDHLNGRQLEGCNTTLQVEFNHPRSRNKFSQGMDGMDVTAPNSCCNIFIKCLPLHYTDADLHNLLSPFGRIVRSTIWKDTQTNQSRGFAFCEFSSPQSATNAIANLNGATLHGTVTPLHAELHNKPSQKQNRQAMMPKPSHPHPANLAATAQGGSPNVFIKGLPKQYGEAQLKEMLQHHGMLVRYTVWKDRNTQESKGFGMAQFDSVDAATAAINQLNNVQLPGSHAPLSLEYHHSYAPGFSSQEPQKQVQNPFRNPIGALPQVHAQRPIFP